MDCRVKPSNDATVVVIARSEATNAAVTKMRLSAFRLPLLSKRARFPELPIHMKEFAGSDDACLEQGAMWNAQAPCT
jgi:hypothetical protein